MGANIGTTLTAWILSLTGIESVSEMVHLFRPATLAALFAVTGVILLIFMRTERGKLFSSAFFSVAVLFFGMMTMTEIALSLAESDFLGGVLESSFHPVVYLLLGILITAALQSSSATVGILQAISVAGVVPMDIALPFLFGVEIGACTAALVSSVGASIEAKRAAAAHLLFNLVGAVVFLIAFMLIGFLFDPVSYSMPISIFGIAIAHSLFNIAVTLLLVPFVAKVEHLLCCIIPERSETDMDVVILEKRFLFSPSFAAKHSYNALLEMVSLVYENIVDALNLIYYYDKDVYHHLVETKSLIDEYEQKLRHYLASLSRKELSEKDGDALAAMLCSVVMLKQLDQIAVDIGKTSWSCNECHAGFSVGSELKEISEPVCDAVLKTFGGFERRDFDLPLLRRKLDSITVLCAGGRHRCNLDLSTGRCTPEEAVAVITYIGHLERAAQCCEELSSYIYRSDFSLCETRQDLF